MSFRIARFERANARDEEGEKIANKRKRKGRKHTQTRETHLDSEWEISFQGYENKKEREKERAREAKQKEKGKQVRMISNRNYEWINIEKK